MTTAMTTFVYKSEKAPTTGKPYKFCSEKLDWIKGTKTWRKDNKSSKTTGKAIFVKNNILLQHPNIAL